jgi:hypothetical protein
VGAATDGLTCFSCDDEEEELGGNAVEEVLGGGIAKEVLEGNIVGRSSRRRRSSVDDGSNGSSNFGFPMQITLCALF